MADNLQGAIDKLDAETGEDHPVHFSLSRVLEQCLILPCQGTTKRKLRYALNRLVWEYKQKHPDNSSPPEKVSTASFLFPR